jgi:hypothetical protein
MRVCGPFCIRRAISPIEDEEDDKLGWVVGVECPVSRDFKDLNRHGWHQKRCLERIGQRMDGNLDGKNHSLRS